MPQATVLAAGVHGPSPVSLLVLTAAAALTAIVAGFAVAAFVRRRSRPYLLIALALSSLVARTALGIFDYVAMVDPTVHHLLEHALDVAMAALVIAAVYLVRSSAAAPAAAARTDGGDEPPRDGGEER